MPPSPCRPQRGSRLMLSTGPQQSKPIPFLAGPGHNRSQPATTFVGWFSTGFAKFAVQVVCIQQIITGLTSCLKVPWCECLNVEDPANDGHVSTANRLSNPLKLKTSGTGYIQSVQNMECPCRMKNHLVISTRPPAVDNVPTITNL